jgi:DNA-directed RNA polymerase specialized sigma24 family protein
MISPSDVSILHTWVSDNYESLRTMTLTLVRSRSSSKNQTIEAEDILNNVLLSILEKPKILYVQMISRNEFKPYLNRAIQLNIFSSTSPTQWAKRPTPISDLDQDITLLIIDKNQAEEEEPSIEDKILNRVDIILDSPSELKTIYGVQWRYFQTLLTNYFGGKNARQVSMDLDIPYHQVSMHLLYARSRLFYILEGEGLKPKNYKLNYKLRCSLSRYSEE